MRPFLSYLLSASLIGAFFISSPITPVSAQPLNQPIEPVSGMWQAPADALPLSNPGRIQANAPKGTVEVVEFFSYTCTHCAAFAPKLSAWYAQQPASVRLLYLPVSWRTDMVASQRLFFTLLRLKRLDLHEQVFADYTNDPEQLSTDGGVLNWALRHGFNKKTWLAAYHSATVTQNMRATQQAFHRFELNGVPTLVVNGRYALIPSNQVLETLDNVVQHERALTQ